jgi:hypothetical protein
MWLESPAIQSESLEMQFLLDLTMQDAVEVGNS